MNQPSKSDSPSTSSTLSPARTTSTSDAASKAGAKLRNAALLTLLLIVIGSVAGLLPRWRQQDALKAETKELAIQKVSVFSPVPGKAPAPLALSAEIKAFTEAPIYARASGYLKRWHVDIGSKVEAGQLLLEIDIPEINQDLTRARAELTQAEAALALAKTTAARWSELLKSASVSEQENSEKQADLALKIATVQATKAGVQRLEELVSFARVTAPFAGIITSRKTDVGELISATGGKELFRLAQTSTLRVFVRVPQTMSRTIAVGQIAEMTVPEIRGRTFPVKVVRTAGSMDAASRTLLTELEMDNARGEILPGSYAQVRFPQTTAEAALTVPASTLLFRAEGMQVGVVRADETVELRNVKVGRDFGPTIEILDGVTTSDRLVSNPADSLVSGTKVHVVEAPKASAGK